jgi:tRNA pseudouridine38-40 synthase
MWCWYHGAHFRGYQAQGDAPTVQMAMRTAMRSAGLERSPVASGRTDAGVHARMMVLSFRLVDGGAIDQVPSRINTHLPGTVGVALAKEAPPHFNAQWRSRVKEYRYRLLAVDGSPWAPFAWRVDASAVQLRATLAKAVGTHDFSAFHDPSSVVKPRTVVSAEVVEAGNGLLDVRLRGEGFGRYMVRSLVGAAVAVARGDWSDEAFEAALRCGGAPDDQPSRRFRAPAGGLTLWNVEYDAADYPFTAEERRAAQGVPRTPPFTEA